MRISDWSSDVCSSDLAYLQTDRTLRHEQLFRSQRKGKAPRRRLEIAGRQQRGKASAHKSNCDIRERQANLPLVTLIASHTLNRLSHPQQLTNIKLAQARSYT